MRFPYFHLIKFVKFINITSQIIYRTMSDDFFDYLSCKECNQANTAFDWCKACNAKRFQQNFEKWTSGNVDIDKFIQDTQLSANYYCEVLEWIPFDRFYDIEYIAKGGFGKVYRANWINGYIDKWDNKNQN